MRANITLTPKQLTLAAASVALGGGVGTLLRALALRIQDNNRFETLIGAVPHNGLMNWWGHVPWILEILNIAGVYLATRILRGPLKNHDPNDLTRVLRRVYLVLLAVREPVPDLASIGAREPDGRRSRGAERRRSRLARY